MERQYPQVRTSPIWKVALGSMLFVALSGASWHFGEMRMVREQERKDMSVLDHNLSVLREYRDVIKKDGTTAGKEYLQNPLNGAYGF